MADTTMQRNEGNAKFKPRPETCESQRSVRESIRDTICKFWVGVDAAFNRRRNVAVSFRRTGIGLQFDFLPRQCGRKPKQWGSPRHIGEAGWNRRCFEYCHKGSEHHEVDPAICPDDPAILRTIRKEEGRVRSKP